MKCGELIRRIEQEIPLEAAEGWDNPGLQVGRREAEVRKVYLALDATDEVVEHAVAWGADLLITHHPLLIEGIRRINSDDFHGRKILKMAEHHLAHYAMHTNFDVCRMARACSSRLGLTDQQILEVTGENERGEAQGIGTVGLLPRSMTVRECCELVKRSFGLTSVRVFGDLNRMVQRAALCPGSGKSLLPQVFEKGAEVYITGDIGHHDGIDAVDQGLAVIDAGHYGVEHIFMEEMEQYLQERFPELTVEREKEKNPFAVL